ncbi:MAG TPA: hypothetical protein PKA63_08770 [Oligoflexia bacterium]|nr:hypothetical protein [Oligoflexia bacterium]HMP48743.1 hypothetical protein [Oligoflexia bacterium]
MIGTWILRILLLCVFVFFGGVFLISFLNRRSSRNDNHMYDPDFNPSSDLRAYKTELDIVEIEADEDATDYYRIDSKKKA